MLNEDAPFYIMQLVQHEKMICEHSRFSVFLYNWIPLIALKAGAGIELLTHVYSIAIDLVYVALFFFALFILKNEKGALMILFFLCIAYGRDFFVPASEFPLAIVATLTLVGMEFRKPILSDWKNLLWSIIILLVSLNFHPIALLSLGFIILYNVIDSRKNIPYWIVLGVVAILIYSARSWLLPFDEYEHGKMKSWDEVAGFMVKPFDIPALAALIKYLARNSSELIIFYATSIFLLVYEKRWLVLVFSLLYTWFILVLFSVIRGVDITQYWYADYFILAGVPALVPFINSLTRMEKYRYATPVTLLAVIIIFTIRVNDYSEFFKNKIGYVERLIANGSTLPEKRYIIDYRNIPHINASNTWPITFQTLLLSSFQSPDSAITFIATNNIDTYDTLITDKSYFLGPEWSFWMYNNPNTKIKKQYFNLPDKGYRKLTTSQQSFSGDSTLFNPSTISIKVIKNSIRHINDSISMINVEIINTSGKVIPAIPDVENATYISYQIIDPSGKKINQENILTTLECDIYKSSLQPVYIYTKSIKDDNITIEIDLVTKNVRWWGCNESTN